MLNDQSELINPADIADAIRLLSEEELIYLNRLIVDRLKLLNQARSTVMLSRFSVGDRVSFSSSNGDRKSGVVTRLNKKTASVITDNGQRWNVHPGFLTADAENNGQR